MHPSPQAIIWLQLSGLLNKADKAKYPSIKAQILQKVIKNLELNHKIFLEKDYYVVENPIFSQIYHTYNELREKVLSIIEIHQEEIKKKFQDDPTFLCR